MDILYYISLISSVLFFSPMPEKEPRQIASQFTVYVDTNSFRDGKVELSLEARFDRTVYQDDCQALYDLYNLAEGTCSPFELARLRVILERMSDTTNYNRL